MLYPNLLHTPLYLGLAFAAGLILAVDYFRRIITYGRSYWYNTQVGIVYLPDLLNLIVALLLSLAIIFSGLMPILAIGTDWMDWIGWLPQALRTAQMVKHLILPLYYCGLLLLTVAHRRKKMPPFVAELKGAQVFIRIGVLYFTRKEILREVICFLVLALV